MKLLVRDAARYVLVVAVVLGVAALVAPTSVGPLVQLLLGSGLFMFYMAPFVLGLALGVGMLVGALFVAMLAVDVADRVIARCLGRSPLGWHGPAADSTSFAVAVVLAFVLLYTVGPWLLGVLDRAPLW